MEQWVPPNNMTATMLHFDFREGGSYRMRLTYKGVASILIHHPSVMGDVTIAVLDDTCRNLICLADKSSGVEAIST